jgi:hypothetical protein
MKEAELLAARRPQHVIKPLLVAPWFTDAVVNVSHIREGVEHPLDSGGEIHLPESRIFGCKYARTRVGNARISIAGAGIVYATELRVDGIGAVRVYGVDGGFDRPLLTGLYVQNMGDKMVSVSIVPDNFRLLARQPLQHTALLPAPCARLIQIDPPVTVLRIDHSYAK